jgi:hypothetical protein
MVAVYGKPSVLGRRKTFGRNSFGLMRVASEYARTMKKMSYEIRPRVFTSVLQIVPMERGPARVSRIHLIPSHTAVSTEWVNRLIPSYRAVSHTDFLSVVRDRRAR